MTETIDYVPPALPQMDNINAKIDCLPCVGGDSGFVRLVDHMGNDLSIVRAARVSYAADWRGGVDTGSDRRLIQYLHKNRHTSPFEAVTFTFEVKAPIMVFRQWHRHRTWSYNEVSGRYTELDMGYYIPEPKQITTQSTSNKQMRTTEQHPRALHYQLEMKLACESAFRTYRAMLADGVPRELARGVLPVFTYSRMFATIDLHNLLHFITLRIHSHAQYEVRVYAEAMLELIKPIVPHTIAAYQGDDFCGVN